jgi:hypothetical protein
MPNTPSIKGSVFLLVVEEVERILATGSVSRDGLGRWLHPGDLTAFAEHPIASGWYPIDQYARMNELLRDVAGGGQNEYLREQGRRTAQQLLASGRYQQVGYAQRTELDAAQTPEERFHTFGREIRFIASVSAAILNFSRWTPRVDPDYSLRYRIEVTEASAFPEVLCWRSDGFVNELANAHGHSGLWRWDRVAPDVIYFRMTRAL